MSILVKHFVPNPKAIFYLETLNLTSEEKEKLTEMVVLIYHQKLLNKFLDYLEEQDRKLFLEMSVTGAHEEVLSFLQQKIIDTEEVVEEALEEIEEKIISDIQSITR